MAKYYCAGLCGALEACRLSALGEGVHMDYGVDNIIYVICHHSFMG